MVEEARRREVSGCGAEHHPCARESDIEQTPLGIVVRRGVEYSREAPVRLRTGQAACSPEKHSRAAGRSDEACIYTHDGNLRRSVEARPIDPKPERETDEQKETKKTKNETSWPEIPGQLGLLRYPSVKKCSVGRTSCWPTTVPSKRSMAMWSQ